MENFILDYPKPWISCPSDVNVVLAPNTNDYDITGLLEQPKSNVKNIQIYPEKYRSNTVFPSGVTVLTYVASNEIGETANCTTDIIVQGRIAFCMQFKQMTLSFSFLLKILPKLVWETSLFFCLCIYFWLELNM